MNPRDQIRTLFHRSPDAHKGDFGRVLVVGGSRGMSGAAVLAGLACLRSGAGLVRLAVPTECQPAVAALEPCLMTVGLPQSKQGKFSWAAWQALQEPARWADVIALGPGLDRSFALSRLVGEAFVRWPQPMVVDADGLNALASGPPLAPAGPRVLTPHPGEFARLARAAELATDATVEMAAVVAQRWGSIVLLKGHRTIVTDGQGSLYRNTTGNPGMATGGCGDVLTGVIAALLAQGLAPWQAARGGALVHGWAGDLAASALGEISLTARDLIDFLPAAFQRWGCTRDAQPESG